MLSLETIGDTNLLSLGNDNRDPFHKNNMGLLALSNSNLDDSSDRISCSLLLAASM